MRKNLLRLRPWKLHPLAPSTSSDSPYPTVQREAYDWSDQPLRSSQRRRYPLLWTLPAALELAACRDLADYEARTFRHVLFDPHYGEPGYPVLLPRAVIINALSSVTDLLFSSLGPLLPQLQREAILVTEDASGQNVGPQVIGMGLPLETSFNTTDFSTHNFRELTLPNGTVDGSKWTAGEVLYLTFPSTQRSDTYPEYEIIDTLSVNNNGDLVSTWHVYYWLAENALAADLAKVPRSVPCYDRVQWYVGVFDQDPLVAIDQLGGRHDFTADWDAFYKTTYRQACAAAGPQHVYEELGPYSDDLVVATAIRVIKSFFHLT